MEYALGRRVGRGASLIASSWSIFSRIARRRRYAAARRGSRDLLPVQAREVV